MCILWVLINYQDLNREIPQLQNCKEVKIIPVVTGALLEWLIKATDTPDLSSCLDLLQKVYLLGTARILRKVLET